MKKRYQKPKKQAPKTFEGVLSITKNGYGFVDISKKNGVFVSQKHFHGAFHGDLVRARLMPGKGRPECEIVEVLERGLTVVTGIIEQHGSHYYLRPYDEKIPVWFFIKPAHLNGGRPGELAVGEILQYHTDSPTVYLKEILGEPHKCGNDMALVLRRYGITEAFPAHVLEQPLPQITEEELANRLDFTHHTVITIDGDDAKDLDDAISVEKKGDGYLLGVHIADVSHYVPGRSAIDMEAYFRGTSVYLPDRAVPMLPEKLSNDLCSLNPGEIKLTFSCLMELDSAGEIVSARLEKSYIQSKKRTSYTKVKALLSGESVPEYEDIRDLLECAYELYQLLKRKRQKRGAVEFSFPEPQFLLDETGIPLEIKARETTFANEMIEEFMLAANVSVAEFAGEQNLPFVYRVHGAPEPEKLEQLYQTLKLFGIPVPRSQGLTPHQLNQILDAANDTEYERAVHQLALRSMQKAIYSAECSGHYGLNYPKYCHFTSPIRRYPDLLIHRILSDFLAGKSVKKYQKFVAAAAEQASDTEQNAFFAERDADDVKKAQYMKQRIGEICRGQISGVVETGFFVELPNTVEGFVPLTSLADDYIYDPVRLCLTGRSGNNVYRIGEGVAVEVVSSDTQSGKIEFRLILPD